jgi:hypothetical protein
MSALASASDADIDACLADFHARHAHHPPGGAV